MAQSAPYVHEPEPFWLMRLSRFLVTRLRPHLGWTVFLALAFMALLPGQAMGVQDWVRVRRLQNMLIVAGPLAVTVGWLVFTWGHWPSHRRWWSILLRLLLAELIGVILLAQLFVRWVPGPAALIDGVRAGSPDLVFLEAGNRLAALATRFALWWQGVQGGGAAQDDLVFAGLVGIVLWTTALLSVLILRRFRQGLAGSLPLLWLISLPLIFAHEGKVFLVLGLVLALLLHVALDQARLQARWRARGWDFSEDLILDRAVAVAGAATLILTLASIMPNVIVRPVSDWYYGLLAPVDERVDAVSERLFPELEGSRRFAGVGAGGGLPNAFLLSAGPDIGQAVVMRVRTSDAVMDSPTDGAPPPEARYMRGATYSDYDGLGWSNTGLAEREPYPANTRWLDPGWQGRRPVVQSVNLTFFSTILYAAAEPLEPSIDYRTQTRGPADLVALYGRAESYSVVSSVPAVSDEMLAEVSAFSPAELPEDFMRHLALPDTVTARTRALAADLTDGIDGPYAQAQAIEAYLRTYAYDLDVPAPPSEVIDVADFFLFDLERGYCDYYATAFVVLARLNGLPTRFASGFAMGNWDGYSLTWTVTEAEAHSWPEVYFPEYGWIAFEPTAGRPHLERTAPPAPVDMSDISAAAPSPESTATEGIDWNWQMLVWLAPLALIVWGGWRLLGGVVARRRDPWQSLLAWGQRIGRPMSTGETTQEYGAELAAYVLSHHRSEPGTVRYVAGEIETISADVTDAYYGPDAGRAAATGRAEARWRSIQGLLRRIRIGV